MICAQEPYREALFRQKMSYRFPLHRYCPLLSYRFQLESEAKAAPLISLSTRSPCLGYCSPLCLHYRFRSTKQVERHMSAHRSPGFSLTSHRHLLHMVPFRAVGVSTLSCLTRRPSFIGLQPLLAKPFGSFDSPLNAHCFVSVHNLLPCIQLPRAILLC